MAVTYLVALLVQFCFLANLTMRVIFREEDFVTEVHHITGAGEDAGVVYSEMQAKENRPSTLMYLKLDQLLYPGNNIRYVQAKD